MDRTQLLWDARWPPRRLRRNIFVARKDCLMLMAEQTPLALEVVSIIFACKEAEW
jgi:hypothetical protein